jgi:NTE family protein
VAVDDAGRSRVHRLGRALVALAAVLAAGCAVRPPTPELARVEPGGGYRLDLEHRLPDNDPRTLFQPQFDVICADLSRFRLSRAAAASSAVPVVLSPVTLDNRGGSCGYRPPQWMAGALDAPRDRYLGNRADLRIRQMELLADGRRRPYIHLVDGGLSDNLGLYGVVEALQELMDNPAYRAAIGAGGLRRIAIVVVNARSAPSLGFDQVPYGPGTFALLMQSISVPMNSYSTESVAALRDMVTEWRLRERLAADALRLGAGGAAAAAVPPVEFTVIDVSFDAVADPHLREYLQNLPTTFALPDEAVDRLRATAAALLRDSPAFRRLVEALAGQP